MGQTIHHLQPPTVPVLLLASMEWTARVNVAVQAVVVCNEFLYQLNNRDPKRSQESLNSASVAGVNGNSSSLGNETDSLLSNGQMEDVWLECDDETISLISRRQFEDELNSKQSATTPYLLFYERV